MTELQLSMTSSKVVKLLWCVNSHQFRVMKSYEDFFQTLVAHG